MAPENVTITVQSEFGEDGPLTVGEALLQVIELFDFFLSAQGENSATVNWRLVSISKSSPLQAVAEPFAVVAGVDVETIARNAKRAVFTALDDITSDVGVPAWMDAKARETVRSILARNTNGIGRTDIKFDDDTPVIMLIPRKANSGLATLQRAEAEILANEPDLSRSETGSIEGRVTNATTFRKQPALHIRDRRSGEEVLCVFSDETAEKAGGHSWREVWNGARVLVYGRIQFDKKGVPATIRVDEIHEINPRDLTHSDITDPNFTGGVPLADYLLQDADGG